MTGSEETEESAGLALDRLMALSDGVFAIAATLLVLDLAVPAGLEPDEYRHALRDLIPSLAAYALSFIVITEFWRAHHAIFRYVRRPDQPIIRLAVLGLGLVALIPFPTDLLAEYGDEWQSVAIYSGTVAAVDVVQLGLVLYLGRHPELLRREIPHRSMRAMVLGLGGTILILGITIAIAWIFGSASKWPWFALIPLKVIAGRMGRPARA
ncbi:TMEM175 family protein [Kitasatospora sp. NPDC094015]|uniref:TMEM175 family protein n=1 Tax=Kitasatospora sp. NPDC094015 TaxID=3155205 RepID=UPI003321FC72